MRLGLAFFMVISVSACARVGMPEPPPAPTDLPPPSIDRYPERDRPPPEAVWRARAPLPPALPSETGDVRALWVVRTALLHPDSARAAVRRAHEAGFNTLLVQVRGRGDAYYRSRYELPPDAMDASLRGRYDPLATVIEEARARGLRVHAWVNAHLIASAFLPPREQGHLARRAPDLLAVPRELAPRLFAMDPRDPRYFETLVAWSRDHSDRVEGLYSSPVSPGVREHLAAVVGDLVEGYPLDGVHLDYIRFPNTDFDYSRETLTAFRAWVREGVRIPAPELARAEAAWPGDPVAYVDAFPEEWDDFRRMGVDRTLERLYWTVKDRSPGTLVSVAVFPDPGSARRERLQSWEEWVRAGYAEVVAPMAYTNDTDAFRRQIARAVEVAGRERVWAGVGIYQNSFDASVRKAREARGMGAGGTILFSYDWAVGPEGTRAAGGPYLSRFARELWP
jgi:uncharacterized lipoprotein YddW (UPF0748 family)